MAGCRHTFDGRICADCRAADPRESDVVARFAYPMGLDGIDKVMRNLGRMYRDEDLVIVIDGPAWRDGWMTIAHRSTRTDVRLEAEAGRDL